MLSLEQENQLLKSANQLLKSANELLKSENQTLKSEGQALKQQIGLNSSNSHKPPSSDGYGKKPAITKNTGKKRGGQPGHQGKNLKMVSKPDEVLLHYANICSCCGRSLGATDSIGVHERRQVFDMPAPKLWVVEHQLCVSYCCGQRQLGTFPAQIQAPVQYGNRILALSSLLNTDYRLPFGKISQLFSDLYGYALNGSTIVSANASLYASLSPVEAEIKNIFWTRKECILTKRACAWKGNYTGFILLAPHCSPTFLCIPKEGRKPSKTRYRYSKTSKTGQFTIAGQVILTSPTANTPFVMPIFCASFLP